MEVMSLDIEWLLHDVLRTETRELFLNHSVHVVTRYLTETAAFCCNDPYGIKRLLSVWKLTVRG